jgi:peptidoglycan/xylan/chitin deacetylase (PgdA/CDA1 family)
MKRKIRKSVEWFFGKIPLPIYHRLINRDVIGLFYHMVSDKAIPHTEHLYPHRDLEIFEQDLIFIKKNYKVLSFDDLLEKQYGHGGKGKPALFLSFDDGFSQCFSLVRPLLLKYELPCMFFITTNFIDNSQMYYRNKVSLCIDRFYSLDTGGRQKIMSAISEHFQTQMESDESFIPWIKSITVDEVVDDVCAMLDVDINLYMSEHKPYMTSVEIQTMAAEGFTIGAHSQRHQKLGRLSSSEIESEIVGSCDMIQAITGETHVPFSFPNTATGVDRDSLNRILVEHPTIGLLFDAKGLDIDRGFIYNRVWVESPKLNTGGNLSLQHVMENAYRDYFMQGLERKLQS